MKAVKPPAERWNMEAIHTLCDCGHKLMILVFHNDCRPDRAYVYARRSGHTRVNRVTRCPSCRRDFSKAALDLGHQATPPETAVPDPPAGIWP